MYFSNEPDKNWSCIYIYILFIVVKKQDGEAGEYTMRCHDEHVT